MSGTVNEHFKDGMKAAKAIAKKDGVVGLSTAYADEHQRRCEAEEEVADLNQEWNVTKEEAADLRAQIEDLKSVADRLDIAAMGRERELEKSRDDIARLESAFAAQDTANHSLLIGLHAAAGMAIKESIQGDRYAENLGDIIQKLTGGPAA